MSVNDNKKMNIKINQNVSYRRASDILCNAFEGGSNYWCELDKRIEPSAWTFGEKYEDNQFHYLHEYPFNKGGAVVLRVAEPEDEMEKQKRYTLDLKAVTRGLQLMADKYPKFFADILSGNDDGETGDALLQLSLFGELIYG